MSEIGEMVKFKTNVSFVGSDGVLHFGGSVVQLPQEDFYGQVEVCEQFGLPVPELTEEINTVVKEGETHVSQTPKGDDKKTAQSEDDNNVDESEL